jgi:hypothetical protein
MTSFFKGESEAIVDPSQYEATKQFTQKRSLELKALEVNYSNACNL